MIVKKKPILQGFANSNRVKKLSGVEIEFSEFNPIFYDIETTGLSRTKACVYLIGAVKLEENCWILYQWMSENSSEEKDLLNKFSDFITGATCTIQYNGSRFDQPFLEERYKQNNMSSPFKNIPAVDLYQLLKPCQKLFKLPHMKQPDLENLIEISSRNYCDGGRCISLYNSYIKNKNVKYAEIVMGHNEEDLLGLGKIYNLLVIKCIFNGDYTPMKCDIIDEKIKFCLQLPMDSPVNLSNGNIEFYIKIDNRSVNLLISMKNNRLKLYYHDYKNYHYIPSEDMAIPKSLGKYMDKSLLKPATKDTCYTWVKCNADFLSSKEKQLKYLRQILPYYLANI